MLSMLRITSNVLESSGMIISDLPLTIVFAFVLLHFVFTVCQTPVLAVATVISCEISITEAGRRLYVLLDFGGGATVIVGAAAVVVVVVATLAA